MTNAISSRKAASVAIASRQHPVPEAQRQHQRRQPYQRHPLKSGHAERAEQIRQNGRSRQEGGQLRSGQAFPHGGKTRGQIEWIFSKESGDHRQRRRDWNASRPRQQKPATTSAIQPAAKAVRKPPSDLAIGLILASVLSRRLARPGRPDDPPPNLARLVAHRETETEAERNQYMYRQSVTLGGTGRARRRARRVQGSPRHYFFAGARAHRRTGGQTRKPPEEPAAHRGGFSRHPRHPAAGADRRPALELRDEVPRRRDHGRCGLLGVASSPAADSGGPALLRRPGVGGKEASTTSCGWRAAPCRRSAP